MSEHTIIYHCAPTLAGIKTGNLFAYQYESREDLMNEIRRFNCRLVSRGVVMLPLKVQEGRALLYVYRPSKLANDLRQEIACQILADQGYASVKATDCIVRLRKRLRQEKDFPHEIGIFLGYPPEDVEGFIRNKGKDCKCCGDWKVYGDVKRAKKCFANHRKCTRMYCELYKQGQSIEYLTVRDHMAMA